MTKRLALLFLSIALLLVTCSTDQGKKQKKKPAPIASLADVFTNLAPASQQFELDAATETLLKGEKGTVLYIPANAFQFSDGTAPTGTIQVELRECYSLSDMIGEGLSTTSGHQLLETAGMIFVKASAQGKELQVKDGKAYVVGFPKKTQTDSMDLFYSYPAGKGGNTWIPDYKMYEAEALKNSENDTTRGEGDRMFTPEYPVEMTDDLYDYGFSYAMSTSTFLDLKLKGQNKTILDYIFDPSNISDSIAREFIKNKWRVHLEFRIDKDGKMYNFKVSDDELTKHNDRAVRIVEEFFRKAPAFDLASYKEKINFDWDYSLGVMGSKTLNWGRFKNKFRGKFAEYKTRAIQKLDKTALNLYLFSATKMNWINCDKFWDTKDEKIDFFVKTKNSKEAKIQLVFTDINSIMKGTSQGDQFVFNNIPVNRKVKVIGISYTNGKPTMSTEMTTTSKTGYELTAFKEFSLDELEKELNKRN